MDLTAELARFPIFSDLTRAQLESVASELSRISFDPGDVLFRQGQPGDAMALLLSGRLSVSVSGPRGEVEVGAVYPFEIFGEMACVEPGPRRATVEADVASEVLFLSRESLERIAERAPGVGLAIRREVLRLLTARLREVDARLEMTFTHGPGASPLDDDDAPASLRAVPLLKEFSEAELRALLTVAPPRLYGPGHILCRQGDQGDSCFIVLRGTVDVVLGPVGEQKVVTTLHAGAVAGQVSLVTGEPRSASLVVRSRSLVLTLGAGDFERLLAAESNFAVRFQLVVIRAAIGQLRAATARLAGADLTSG